jgi:hypothetical protein
MPEEISRRLLDWGGEAGEDAEAEVIVVDFRRSGSVHAAIIGVRKAFSLGELIPQLIAMAFNDMRAPEIESAVEASGVPCTFVHPKFFERSRMQTQNDAFDSHQRETVATVITDDGKADNFVDLASNDQVVKILSRMAKLPVVYVDLPENIARHSMRQLGMPVSLIEGLLRARQFVG